MYIHTLILSLYNNHFNNNNTSSDETLPLLLNIIASYDVCSEPSDPMCQRGVPIIRGEYMCSRDGSEIKSRLPGVETNFNC